MPERHVSDTTASERSFPLAPWQLCQSDCPLRGSPGLPAERRGFCAWSGGDLGAMGAQRRRRAWLGAALLVGDWEPYASRRGPAGSQHAPARNAAEGGKLAGAPGEAHVRDDRSVVRSSAAFRESGDAGPVFPRVQALSDTLSAGRTEAHRTLDPNAPARGPAPSCHGARVLHAGCCRCHALCTESRACTPPPRYASRRRTWQARGPPAV